MAIYSSLCGEVAAELSAEGIPVLGDPGHAPWGPPDLIHGQHEWETSIAALRWPDRPVISFCRGLHAWQEAPCRAPNVVRWVAIDEPCLSRITETEHLPAERALLMFNGIDLNRFVRRPPLPRRPSRALLFSNYATASDLLPVVRHCCEQLGIALEAIGSGVGRIEEHPERFLGQFDLVFAKGKAALEAVVTGCAVIVCDVKGLGPLVTASNVVKLRGQSFGYPCMSDPVTGERIAERVAQWNPSDARDACEIARKNCGIGLMFDEMEALYQAAAEEGAPDSRLTDWTKFAADLTSPKSVAYKAGRQIQEYFRESRGSPAPGNPVDARVEHDRILDSYRKGVAARNELKALTKRKAAKG